MNKYIIYQGSGGLIHLLGGLVYCCDYIKNKKNYLLVIDIKNHKSFLNYFSNYFTFKNIKYTENYNEIISSDNYYKIKLSYLDRTNVKYEKNSGYIHKFNNNYINIGHSLDTIKYYNNIKMYAGNGGNNKSNIIKYIKCNDKIKSKLKDYKINEKYIGIHFRNTDRYNDINNCINKIKKLDSKFKHYKIYIATDDIKALYLFKKELKDYDIFYYFEPYDAKGGNIHFNDPDKDKVIMSILIDMYMLYHCDIFIDSPNSLVSKLVNYMRISKESIFE